MFLVVAHSVFPALLRRRRRQGFEVVYDQFE
jgi:hypothetical protein